MPDIDYTMIVVQKTDGTTVNPDKIPKKGIVKRKVVGYGWDETEEEPLNTKKFNDDLESRSNGMTSGGYRKSNLPGMHNYEVTIKRGNSDTIERIYCVNCSEPFLANINGNRIVIDSNMSRFFVVKFVELLAICPKCDSSYHIDLHDIYDPDSDNEYDLSLQEHRDIVNGDLEPYNLTGDYSHARSEMKRNNIVDPNKKLNFLKKEMIKDRRNKIA